MEHLWRGFSFLDREYGTCTKKVCRDPFFFCVRCMEFYVDFLFFQLLPPPRQILLVAISIETWIGKSSFRSWLVGHFFFAFGLYASRFFSLGFFLIVFLGFQKNGNFEVLSQSEGHGRGGRDGGSPFWLSHGSMERPQKKTRWQAAWVWWRPTWSPPKIGGLYRRPWQFSEQVMSIARRKHRKGGEQLTWEILVESLEPLVTNFPTFLKGSACFNHVSSNQSNPSKLDAYNFAPCRCTSIHTIHTHCPSHHPPDNPQGLDTGSTTFEVGSFCLPTMTCCGNKNAGVHF